MRRLRALMIRFGSSVGIPASGPEGSDDDIRSELQSHVELQTAELIRRGVEPSEARRQALVAAGGMTGAAESVRQQYRFAWLEQARADVRYALRGLRRSPGFATTAILTLALGVGANAAMFGVVDRLMFRPYAYMSDPGSVHRIYLVDTRVRGRLIRPSGVEYKRYLDLKAHTSSFASIAVFAHPMAAIGTGADSRERMIAVVSGTFWDFFDARPHLGRFFTAAEDTTPRGADVAVLGHSFWRSELGGRDVIGERLVIGTMTVTVVGIAPPGFTGVTDIQEPAAYVPVTSYASTYRPGDISSYYTDYSWGWLSVMARRKPGVSLERASADASNAHWRSWEAERVLEPQLDPAEAARPAAIVSAMRTPAGPDPSLEARTTLWLLGVGGIVLLIACANVANLLLARSAQRQRELAVRLAIGASRGRLAVQALTESLVLALLGGVAGLVVAQWVGSAMQGTIAGLGNTSLNAFTDWRTVSVVGGLVLVVAIVTGVVPALMSGRNDLAASLRAGAREGNYRHSGARTVLLVAQAALSTVLLVGAALFVNSLNHVRDLRIGYDAENVLVVYRNMRGSGLDSAAHVAQRRAMVEAAGRIPGVLHAAWVNSIPLGSTSSTSVFVPGRDSVDRLGQFSHQLTTPGYFDAMGTRILQGRGILDSDRAGAAFVAVVSESMARTLWPGRSALGQCFKHRSDTMPCTTVVGIAEDIVQRENQLGSAARLHYYLPIEQVTPQRGSFLLVRTGPSAATLTESVRKSLQSIVHNPAYVTVQPLTQGVESAQRSWRLGATLFVAFGGLALVVAAVGLYGVVSYGVTQRMHELGVRVALGAGRHDIVRLVVGQSARLALSGVFIGCVLALGAGRWVEPLLYQQSATDPAIYATVGGIMIVVALLAAAAPSLRATRADPNSALRAE
jgi:putative ABC transport system permease protein